MELPSPREGVYRRSSLFLPILAVGLLFWLLVETSGSGLAVPGSPEGMTGGQTLWPEGGVPLCTAYWDQDWLEMAEDGAGGAIVVWQDYRHASSNDGPSDLYARRVYSDGTPAWLTDGVPICLAPNSQWWPQIVGDGDGGAVIAWGDYRSGEGDIYAQRVLSDGIVAWTTDGISLCTAAADQYVPVLIHDGTSGAIVAWEDHRGADTDIYAQRVYGDGTLAWATDGISLSVAAGDQGWPAITSDGAGGAIVAWHGGCGGSPGICAQRVHPDGSVAWTPGGVAVSSGPGYYPQIAGDQAGGAIVVWQTDYGSAADLYAQRVYSDGVVAWAAGGVPLTLAPGGLYNSVLASDGNGGAIVAWQDERPGHGVLIYAQRVRSSGLVAWAPNGIPVTEVGSSRLQWSPDIIDDGQGGAIVTWQGWRGASGYPHIYAQQLHRSGAWLWGADGLAVCEVFEGAGQTRPRLVGSGIADAIITWEDNRRWYKEDELDVYAQRVRGITYRLYLPSIQREH
jgi:hypothetical protein